METPQDKLPRLGSLAQAARGKQLNQARWTLIFIGALMLIVNGAFLYNSPSEVKKVLDKEIGQQGALANPAHVKEAEQMLQLMAYVIYGGAALLGLLFIVFGLIIKLFPVPVTITSLVLYVLASAGFAILNPASLAQGILIKIIIVIGLFKAIQAAFAYQREKAEAADLEPGFE